MLNKFFADSSSQQIIVMFLKQKTSSKKKLNQNRRKQGKEETLKFGDEMKQVNRKAGLSCSPIPVS